MVYYAGINLINIVNGDVQGRVVTESQLYGGIFKTLHYFEMYLVYRAAYITCDTFVL